jgi:uncharacterized protein (DUF305 family)
VTRRFPARLVALAVAGSLALAACGGDDDAAGTSDTTVAAEPSGTAAAGSFNDADVTFAQGMIPHHEQAVEMAEIALDPARQASPEVVALAARVQGAQDPEIELMRGLLASWGKEEIKDMGEDHAAHGMSGMMTADQMAALEEATGAEFDTMWMEMMIQHHEGAIEMAGTAQSDGSAPEIQALAGEIIAAQEAEIGEMKGLLAG